jgi:CheY-like chemotaxis protein
MLQRARAESLARTPMGLVSLIFSDDERTVRILKLLLRDLSIQVEHTSDLDRAQVALRQQKYDGVFAECEDEAGAALLRSVRKSKHNRRSIAFALSRNDVKMSVAFELGAHFIIHKPPAVEKVKRTLNAAHGLMMREQRIHFRHPLSTHVSVRLGRGAPYNALLRDLSQNGALIESGTVLKRGQEIQLNFILPDTSVPLEAYGRVTWSDFSGRAGVKFEILAETAQQELLQWVMERSFEIDKTQVVISEPTEEDLALHDEPPEFDIEVEVVEPEDVDKRLRATLRGQHHAPIKVLTFHDGRPVVISGTCSNLSESGLAAELEEEMPIEYPMLVQVRLPGKSDALVLHAIARHREDLRYGFEFVGISDPLRELLRTCVLDLPVD